MIKLFLSSFFVVIIYTPYGILLWDKFSKKNISFENFSYNLIYSGIILSFIALLFNFFVSLNLNLNTFLVLFSLIIILINKNYFISKKYIIFSFLCAILIFLLICQSNTYRPDSGIYHYPFINILNEEKIIFGLNNLHFRFGHVSIVQYYSAILNNLIFSTNGMVFATSLIYVGVFVNFIILVKNYLLKKKYNYHFFYLLAILIYVIAKLNRYSEFGNDTPSHLLFFFLISELLKNLNKKNFNDISNIFLISIYIIMNKIILSFAVFLPFIYYKNKYFWKFIFLKKTVFIFIFLTLWFIKNVITSGCAIYPASTTCINNLYWSDLNETEYVSNENEAWSKGWYNYNELNNISHKKYIDNFGWIKTWKNITGLKILKILGVYTFFLLIIFYLLFKEKKSKKKIEKLNYLYLIISILTLASLVWFLKVPDFRYGLSYLVSLIALVFSLVASKYKIRKNFEKKIFIILFLCLCVFLIKNFSRIIQTDKTYYNYPWPKYFSHSQNNELVKPKKNIIDGKLFYFSENGLCMYGYAPCSPKEVSIILEKKYNYFFITK